MIELPHPDFAGANDGERLEKVIRYLEQLHAALETKFSNIDASDLNAATAAQLEGGTVPDLSAYATRAALDAQATALKHWVDNQGYATHLWVEDQGYVQDNVQNPIIRENDLDAAIDAVKDWAESKFEPKTT